VPPTPLRRTTAILLAIVALHSLSACGLFGGEDDPTPTTAPAPITTTTTVPAPTTELLDPGREPRRALRFRFEAGEVTIRTIVDLAVVQQADEAFFALDLPPVQQTVRLTTAPAGDGRDAEVSLEVTALTLGAGATAEEREALEAELGALVGLRGTGRIDELGRVVSFDYDLDVDVSADLDPIVAGFGDQLEALVAPLPEEPVGVGARWRTTTAADLGGTSVPVATVYEVTELTGDQVSYSSTGEGTAADRPIESPEVPTGTTAHLVEVRTTSQGSGTLSFRSPAAVAVVRSDTIQSVRFEGPDRSSVVDQQTVVDLVVAPFSDDG